MHPMRLFATLTPNVARLVAVEVIALLLATTASAVTIAHEPFDYPLGPFGTPANGGTGFTGGWTSNSGNDIVQGLSYPGVASSGNAVLVMGQSNPDRGIRLIDGSALGDEMWIGFLFSLPSANNGFVGITIGSDNTTGAGLGIGATGATEFALSETREPGGGVGTGVTPTLDTTYLLVTRILFQPGNDVAQLFLNPDPSTPPISPDAVKSDFAVVNRGELFLTAFQGGSDVVIDEIRVGSEFGDVVQTVVPEPATGLLLGLGLVALAVQRQRS